MNEIKKLLDNSYNFKEYYKNKFVFIQKIMNIFEDIDYTKIKEDDLFDYIKITDITLNKIIEMNNNELLEKILEILIKLLKYFNLQNYHRYSLEIIE